MSSPVSVRGIIGGSDFPRSLKELDDATVREIMRDTLERFING
jgi:hypothetical protein